MLTEKIWRWTKVWLVLLYSKSWYALVFNPQNNVLANFSLLRSDRKCKVYWKCSKGKDLMFQTAPLWPPLSLESENWVLVEVWAEPSNAWTFSHSLARKDLPWWDINFLNGPTLSHATACVLDSQRDWRAASSAFPLVSQMRDPKY